MNYERGGGELVKPRHEQGVWSKYASAIVGILARPGGDARGRVPSSRYNVAAFHDPTGKHGTVITEYGYFLEEDIGALDTSFFSMPRTEVERTDPQQGLMLELTRECVEDAGQTAWRGMRIGCYMGSLGEDWCEMFARETQNRGDVVENQCTGKRKYSSN